MMAKQRIERQNTSWRISVEAKRLLERMAQKAGTSQSAVFEQAIREKARREKITLDGEQVGAARDRTGAPVVTPEERQAALERFRQLVEKARSHDTGERTPEQIEQEVALAVAEVHAASPSIWERLLALADEVPDDEMAGRPNDIAAQHDHYLYGTPKKP